MKKHGYPRRDSHVKEHEQFIEDFNKFISEYNYNGVESSVELLTRLNEWFFKHTQTTDKFLAKFLTKYETR